MADWYNFFFFCFCFFRIEVLFGLNDFLFYFVGLMNIFGVGKKRFLLNQVG